MRKKRGGRVGEGTDGEGREDKSKRRCSRQKIVRALSEFRFAARSDRLRSRPGNDPMYIYIYIYIYTHTNNHY